MQCSCETAYAKQAVLEQIYWDMVPLLVAMQEALLAFGFPCISWGMGPLPHYAAAMLLNLLECQHSRTAVHSAHKVPGRIISHAFLPFT